ncbi:conserved hypothetical protein [Trichinella spiralis]|uniref:hypothetical protein n=1 Tax=Trichinella spiralis TaxID=6334 RepID=UPI0001EFD29C|nr:conserved hypothetical protein [Trichinella spiralis]
MQVLAAVPLRQHSLSIVQMNPTGHAELRWHLETAGLPSRQKRLDGEIVGFQILPKAIVSQSVIVNINLAESSGFVYDSGFFCPVYWNSCYSILCIEFHLDNLNEDCDGF